MANKKEKKKNSTKSSRKSGAKLDKKREKISDKADTKKRKTKKKTLERNRENLASPNAVLPVNRRRIALGFGVILLLMFALMLRMGYWQIVRADELRIMATEMQKVDSEIDPARGSIYDSRMNVLAESVTEYELYAYSQQLYKSTDIDPAIKKSTLKILYEITGKSEAEIEKILTGEEKISDMPVEYYDNPVKEYDADRCAKLGITVPDGYQAYTAEN